MVLLVKLHAPEVECIENGKARQPYEFGVKTGFAVTHKKGLIVGVRTFPETPYHAPTMVKQLVEQTRFLLEDHGTCPKPVYMDLGYSAVDHTDPDVQIIHRGKYKSIAKANKKRLKRR